MIKLQDLIKQYEQCTTKEKVFEIDGRQFKVVSHFIGNKNIDEILTRLAIKQAYREI